MARHNFTTSDFYCTCCGTKGMPLARKMSRQRAAEHLKKLYCIKCKQEVNHVELRPFDYDYEQLMEDIRSGVYYEEEK